MEQSAPPVLPRRRRHSRIQLPRWFCLVLLGCVVAVGIALELRPGERAASLVSDTPSPFTEGLSLEGVRFDPPQGGDRRIVGVVRNSRPTPLRNVSLSLTLWVRRTGEAGRRQVEIRELPARGEVAFSTEPIPPEVVRWGVEGLHGEK